MNDGEFLLKEELRGEWETARQHAQKTRNMAGLFRGWAPKSFRQAPKRILYVGKQTSGPFQGDNVEGEAFNAGPSSFWLFARELAEAAGCSSESLDCVASSNISKIAFPQTQADELTLQGLVPLATATLEAEIADLQPHIVVFVTMRFGEGVVRTVAAGREDGQWNKSENESIVPKESDVWWKRRPDGVAVLWMRHPQGADSQLRRFAAAKVTSLM